MTVATSWRPGEGQKMARKAHALSELSDDDVVQHYHHSCLLTLTSLCSVALTIADAKRVRIIYRMPELTEDARSVLLRYMLAHHRHQSSRREYHLLGVAVCKVMFSLCTSASKEKIRSCMPLCKWNRGLNSITSRVHCSLTDICCPKKILICSRANYGDSNTCCAAANPNAY